MTVALALEYIPRRMKELGVGNEYSIRFRHFILASAEVLTIEADNQFFMLTEEASQVTILSEMGYYDISDALTNEQSYEHQGTITITNNSTYNVHLRFIQAIPNTSKK